jgi:hypothetical protein
VPVGKFCPEALEKVEVDDDPFPRSSAYLTAAVFSHDGAEILGSYNDDDIYLFPTTTTTRDVNYQSINPFRFACVILQCIGQF